MVRFSEGERERDGEIGGRIEKMMGQRHKGGYLRLALFRIVSHFFYMGHVVAAYTVNPPHRPCCHNCLPS